MVPALAFKHARAASWTREKIDSLTTAEVRQLRVNALRLAEMEIAALCEAVLGARSRGLTPPRRRARKDEPQRLVSRSMAFGMRGVHVHNRLWSRSGVRQSDGAIVFALWADQIQTVDGVCQYLLWAPNTEGARPWSDTPAGQERLDHCRRASEGGNAEGLLVYGEPLDGVLPDQRVRSVHGADPAIVLTLRVEKRAHQYWATWGGRPAAGG